MISLLANLPVIIAGLIVGLGTLLVINADKKPIKRSKDKKIPHHKTN